MVSIKQNGKVIAQCNGSELLGLSPKQEYDMFIDAYKKIFPKVIINGIVQENEIPS